MTTFDSDTYRTELDQLCFSDEQKARMAQRLKAAARTNKVLELHGTQPATASARSDERDSDRGDARRTTRWSASRTARPQRTHRRSSHRIAAAIGIAAVLAIGGGTAYATAHSPARRTRSPPSLAPAPRRPSLSTRLAGP